MTDIKSIFWDLGGVVLSNAWDLPIQQEASAQFDLDLDELLHRHDQFHEMADRGQITFEEYLDHVVFQGTTHVSKEAFRQFIYSHIHIDQEVLEIVQSLARVEGLRMFVLNNEQLELNQYRIEKFNLQQYFSAFLSSCFLGVRKPAEGIFEKALQITQSIPRESLFVDDQAPNIECAQGLGFHTILYRDSKQLILELIELGLGNHLERA